MMNGDNIPRWAKVIAAILTTILGILGIGTILLAPISTQHEQVRADVDRNTVALEETHDQLHDLEREMIDRLGRIETKIDNLNGR